MLNTEKANIQESVFCYWRHNYPQPYLGEDLSSRLFPVQAWSPLSFTLLSAEAWHHADRADLEGLILDQLWSQKPVHLP